MLRTDSAQSSRRQSQCSAALRARTGFIPFNQSLWGAAWASHSWFQCAAKGGPTKETWAKPSSDLKATGSCWALTLSITESPHWPLFTSYKSTLLVEITAWLAREGSGWISGSFLATVPFIHTKNTISLAFNFQRAQSLGAAKDLL